MKVLYDHQIFEHQRIGGVSRYFSEIIKHLPDDVEADVSVLYSFNEYLKGLDVSFEWRNQLTSYFDFMGGYEFRGKKSLFAYMQKKNPQKYPDYIQLNKENSIQKLKTGDFDVFHPTFFQDYYLEYLKDKPYVLTVHDMIIELYPEFINSLGFVQRKKRLVDNSAHIIAVSENTKHDIVNVFGTDPNKISVIHHASSLSENRDKPDGLPEKYLLYVGDRRLGYKNFGFFVSSIQPVLLQNKDLYLVCTGDSFTVEENVFFQALGIKDQIQIKYVDDKQMYGLYNSAQMFVYPSYYEGFGIPIVEAFQAGCPVVLSDSSCFPEVASDAGVYFKPKSPHELRQAVINILNDKQHRDDVIKKGRQRLADFSWSKSAMQTAEVYKKVLQRR